MSDKRPCIHCNRNIDRFAKSCVYCSWDQNADPASTQMPMVGAGPAYVPPVDHRFRNRALGLLAFVALVIGAFGVGAYLHGSDPRAAKLAKAQTSTAPKPDEPPAPARKDLLVVPASGLPIAEAPITTAPAMASASGVPAEYQRNDATAATSEEYAQLAARAKQERRTNATIDPRTIQDRPSGDPATARTASAPRRTVSTPTSPPPRREAVTVPMRSSQPAPPPVLTARTPPIPISQPIPTIHVSRNTTARLDLTIGPDGSVRDVNILEPIPGETAKLIAAIQAWRFKPGTENGVPTTTHFSVDISFHGNE